VTSISKNSVYLIYAVVAIFLTFTAKFELWDVRTAPVVEAFLAGVKTTVLVVQEDATN
jgi:hypothetical protein